LNATDRAVRLVPNDAETHSARGIVLQQIENYPESCRELERAIRLRPRDYFLWMLLGVSRDFNQDQDGAVRALRQAIALAPAYAKSHWLLGNLFLRMNNPTESFQELRLAAASDESLWPNVVDLAWSYFRGDVAQTIAEVRPQSDNARMSLAILCAGHQQGAAALAQWRAVSSPPVEGSQNLLKALLNARPFSQAYTIWARLHHLPATLPSLLNADFEDEIALGQNGFGWQIAGSSPSVVLSADPSQFHSGKKSLRIDFHGDSAPDSPAVSQLIVLNPGTSYRLSFHPLSKEFVSLAPPLILISHSLDEKRGTLGQSAALSAAKDWQEFSVDFTTGANTNAVRALLVRRGCAGNPCAAFGTLWLDSFDLKTLSANLSSRAPAK